MKHILITADYGNIGNEIILELFKKNYQITILTNDLKKSQKQITLPVKFLEHSLKKSPVSSKQLEGIGSVLIIPSQTHFATELDFVRINNLINSFNSENVHFLYLGSYKIYKSSSTHITENSPVSEDIVFEYERKIEKLLLRKKSTIIRCSFILSLNNIHVYNMQMLYRFYLGAKLKSENIFSWIHIDDVIENLELLINATNIRKIVNLASGPLKLSELHSIFSSITNRKNILSFPSFILNGLKLNTKLLKDKNLDLKSIHQDLLKYKFTDFQSALRELYSYLETPTLKRPMFHYKYTKVQFINRDIKEVFDFFKDAKNLETITPKKLQFKIISQSTTDIQEGTRFTYTLKLNSIPFRWTTFIENWNPPYKFTDYQESGPYQVWYHTHSFYECAGGTLMIDDVRYRLPLGFFGDLFGLLFVKKNIKEIFQYRFDIIKDLL